MAHIFFRIYDGIFILYIHGNTRSKRSFLQQVFRKNKALDRSCQSPCRTTAIYYRHYISRMVFYDASLCTSEGSIDPGGLPHRWIIKSVLVLSFVLFGIATVARSIAIVAKLRKLTGDAN